MPRLRPWSPLNQGPQRPLPGRLRPGPPGHLQPVRRVDLRVFEAATVTDPALVDLVVLVGGDTDQLVPALPEHDVAADRAPGADRGDVVHVPGARLEAPHPAGESSDRTEVDDVAGEHGLERLVELAGDVRVNAALVGGQLLRPGDLVVVARAAIAEDAALPVQS